MSALQFLTLTRDHDTSEVLAMMRGLYAEDPPAVPVDHRQFSRTLELLLAEPCRGAVIIFEEAAVLRGYAILIPYWSNEYGGTLLFVDEIFVKPAYRCHGIAHRFFEHVAANRPFDAVAVALEVSPANQRAQRLYASIGFSDRRNSTLIRRF
jgi:GNAT superfamily N-acetyltransferase